jgi:hypothetical protein
MIDTTIAEKEMKNHVGGTCFINRDDIRDQIQVHRYLNLRGGIVHYIQAHFLVPTAEKGQEIEHNPHPILLFNCRIS